VLIVDGTAEVENDIILDKGVGNTWASLSSIPSFYLISSGDIILDNDKNHGETAAGLKEVDGVYVAEPNPKVADGGGQITTCTSGSSGTYDGLGGLGTLYSNCGTETLTIDGAMSANLIRLNRTFGNTNSGPAELFTYNPNTWMVNPFNASSTPSGNPTYQSITALPPVL
jgi:hypothetical protein